MTGTTPSLPSKGRLDMISFTCASGSSELPGMRWGRTLTLAVPPSTDTHLNLQLLGGRHRAGGEGQEATTSPTGHFPRKGRGWKSCFHVSRTWKPKMGALKDWALVRLAALHSSGEEAPALFKITQLVESEGRLGLVLQTLDWSLVLLQWIPHRAEEASPSFSD